MKYLCVSLIFVVLPFIVVCLINVQRITVYMLNG